jgi:hypothetical protein
MPIKSRSGIFAKKKRGRAFSKVCKIFGRSALLLIKNFPQLIELLLAEHEQAGFRNFRTTSCESIRRRNIRKVADLALKTSGRAI